MNDAIFGGLDSDTLDVIVASLFPPSAIKEGSDHACKVYRREIDFSNLEWWDRAAKELTYTRYRCDCEYDCCGCFVGQKCKVVDEGYCLFVELERHYNY